MGQTGKTGILLALDQATTTGWAVGEIGQPFVTTPVELRAGGRRAVLTTGVERVGDPRGMRRWLKEMHRTHRLRGILFESPILIRGGKKQTSFSTVAHAQGLKHAIEAFADDHGLWCAENGRSSAYKSAVGRGNATKEEAREHLRALGFDVTSLDESDAIVHWHAAALILREKGW